ncbi:hypothetical protein [Paraburkholderia caribensis]|uniref:hypothetical protein n=1 Tax=Paraburkholderia caribensis TaxID=75105 RepID=UPI001D084548|nr:hypothetical protein [Paraburkholderia caribensis]
MQQDRWRQVYRIICRSMKKCAMFIGFEPYPVLRRTACRRGAFSVAIDADLLTIDLYDAISAVTARIAVLAGIRPCLLPRLA